MSIPEQKPLTYIRYHATCNVHGVGLSECPECGYQGAFRGTLQTLFIKEAMISCPHCDYPITADHTTAVYMIYDPDAEIIIGDDCDDEETDD